MKIAKLFLQEKAVMTKLKSEMFPLIDPFIKTIKTYGVKKL